MKRRLEIQSPLFFKDKRGDVQDTFYYVGVLLDIAFETTIKELGILDKDDEFVSMKVDGDDIEVESIFVDSLSFTIIERKYEAY